MVVVFFDGAKNLFFHMDDGLDTRKGSLGLFYGHGISVIK